MNRAIRIGAAFMALSTIALVAEEVVVPKFSAAKENYELKAKAVRELSKLEFKNLSIVDIPLDQAIATLSELLRKAGDSPVNYVVRHSGEIISDDPFWKEDYSPAPLKKVTITQKSTSYIEALDRICSAGGYVWEIELSQDGRTPIIVATPRR